MKLVSTRRIVALASAALLAMGALGLAAPAAAQQQVFSAMVSSGISGGGLDPDYLVGTIPGSAGRQIRIIRVGLAGDATDQSGPHAFQAVGAGLDFTWGAGQVSLEPLVPLDYDLAPTVLQIGSPEPGRGFTYSGDINQTGASGQPVQIRWRGTRDWDGLYAWGTDSRGTAFDDSATTSSARVWVLYEYLGEPTAVPTQGDAALALLALLVALAGVVALNRRRMPG
jgi:hypothetical protein